MSINTENISILFNDILSRCDTIHDFTGERAKKVMQTYDNGFDTNSVYSYLHQTPSLNIENIRARFTDRRTLEDLNLILRRKENPNFNFLQSYRNGVDERSCGYEPSVVQFFEHALGQYDMLDAFYLLSSAYIKDTCLIDYTDDATKRTMDKILGKICIMELGNVGKAKDDDGDGNEITRDASGIWQNDTKLADFRANLKEFFTDFNSPSRRIRFVIDASIVSNDIFHEADSEDGIKVALLACSEWDSATKYSKGIPVPSAFWTNNLAADRVLYQLESMMVASGKPEDKLVVEFDARLVFNLDKIPREVGNIVEILIHENAQQIKPNYSPSDAVQAITKSLPKLNQKDQKAIQGIFFDIKRSGDGCQVIQIKQENAKEDAKFKYVLVTNDHLAFLKARMNRVPVVFTKRNTITGNKRLFLINDVEKGMPEDLAKHLISSLEKENDALQSFLSGTDQIETIIAVFDRVIKQFLELKAEMEKVYFGPGPPDDEHFSGLLLRAIIKKEQVPALSPGQRQDLEFISMRMKAYLYDFFAINLDLKMRRAMIERVFEQYNYLSKITDETLMQCNSLYDSQNYEDVIMLCRNTLSKHAAVKTRGYGHVLYDWTLETDIVGTLQRKFDEINGQLEIPATAIALLTNKHFLLQDSIQIQTILNFKPLKVYNDIWRFLSASFKSLSMTNQAPRTSRRSNITTKSDGSSAFLMKAKEFIGRAEKVNPLGTQIPSDLNGLIDEVCGMDEFYKLLIMEDNAQNFSLKMVDAGFVDDWLSTNKFSGGGGTDPMYPIDPMNSDDDEINNFIPNQFSEPIPNQFYSEPDDDNYNNTNKRPRNINNDSEEYDYPKSLKRSRPTTLQDDVKELRTILYFDFLECFYGLYGILDDPNNCIYHSHAKFIKLERTIESYIRNINDFKGMGANDAIEMILNANQQFAGGGEYQPDPEKVDMVADIIKQCRSAAFDKQEWKSVIRAMLQIRQPENVPRYVTDNEWVRFLTNKLLAMPKEELKALHSKRCARL